MSFVRGNRAGNLELDGCSAVILCVLLLTEAQGHSPQVYFPAEAVLPLCRRIFTGRSVINTHRLPGCSVHPPENIALSSDVGLGMGSVHI